MRRELKDKKTTKRYWGNEAKITENYMSDKVVRRVKG